MLEQVQQPLMGDMQTGASAPVLGMPLYIGLGIVFVFFFGFAAWAFFTPLESAAVAPGEVSVDTKRKTILKRFWCGMATRFNKDKR